MVSCILAIVLHQKFLKRVSFIFVPILLEKEQGTHFYLQEDPAKRQTVQRAQRISGTLQLVASYSH